MRTWLGRALIGAVLIMNVQAGVSFFLQPALAAPAYELEEIVGEAALRGFGVLFLMWNVPYLVAFFHPVRYRLSLYEAVAMQSIGLLGETIIRAGLPLAHTVARAGLARFILFDGLGLVALLLAVWITRRQAP